MDGSGARFKARRVVDPERASHRCHYHHGLAPSPALNPTQHHTTATVIRSHLTTVPLIHMNDNVVLRLANITNRIHNYPTAGPVY